MGSRCGRKKKRTGWLRGRWFLPFGCGFPCLVVVFAVWLWWCGFYSLFMSQLKVVEVDGGLKLVCGGANE